MLLLHRHDLLDTDGCYSVPAFPLLEHPMPTRVCLHSRVFVVAGVELLSVVDDLLWDQEPEPARDQGRKTPRVL